MSTERELKCRHKNQKKSKYWTKEKKICEWILKIVQYKFMIKKVIHIMNLQVGEIYISRGSLKY